MEILSLKGKPNCEHLASLNTNLQESGVGENRVGENIWFEQRKKKAGKKKKNALDYTGNVHDGRLHKEAKNK